jgi:hypothetical protein
MNSYKDTIRTFSNLPLETRLLAYKKLFAESQIVIRERLKFATPDLGTNLRYWGGSAVHEWEETWYDYHEVRSLGRYQRLPSGPNSDKSRNQKRNTVTIVGFDKPALHQCSRRCRCKNATRAHSASSQTFDHSGKSNSGVGGRVLYSSPGKKGTYIHAPEITGLKYSRSQHQRRNTAAISPTSQRQPRI